MSREFDKLKPLSEGLNAFSFTYEDSLLDEVRDAYLKKIGPLISQKSNRYLLEGGQLYRQPFSKDYYLYSYESDPLLWISNASEETYHMFLRLFDSLDIQEDVKQLVAYKRQIRMYSGFFVIGNRAPEPNWHYDYFEGANAYTLITPLFELDKGHGNLNYEVNVNQTATYMYKKGEAIILGDHFLHSTEPYSFCDKIRVLLSLTFGTDTFDSWSVLKKTITTQSSYTVLPCGHLVDTCRCLWQNNIQRLMNKIPFNVW